MKILLLSLSLLLSACLEQSAQVASTSGDWYPVSKVIDGDTFWIQDGSEKGKKVRLIGIDAPETRRTKKKEVGYYGKEAKEYVKTRLSGQKVRLEYDVDQIDHYGRLLAYVYLEDGTFLNEELLRLGYAVVMTVPPNVKFADQFIEIQREAREAKRGLWGE
ncbi:MAG TPA: nuclease [Bacteroidetes bacterium]|nr:nuclease [Bacteroidota bacterium]